MRDGVGQCTTTTDKVANVREDTGEVLGWVGNNYKRIQNIDVAELAYAVAGNDTKVKLLAVFAMVLVLISCCSSTSSPQYSDDVTKEYLLLANGHDGLMAFNAIPTGIRVVCANTLAIAMSQANAYRIAHKVTWKTNLLICMMLSLQPNKTAVSLKTGSIPCQSRHDSSHLKDYYDLMYNKYFNQVDDKSSDRDWKKIETTLKWENRFEIEAALQVTACGMRSTLSLTLFSTPCQRVVVLMHNVERIDYIQTCSEPLVL